MFSATSSDRSGAEGLRVPFVVFDGFGLGLVWNRACPAEDHWGRMGARVGRVTQGPLPALGGTLSFWWLLLVRASGVRTSDQKVEQTSAEVLNRVHQPLPPAPLLRRAWIRSRIRHFWLLGCLVRHDQRQEGKL